MSRLCRLRNASHGDDGQWAYSEIVGLREQVEKKSEENKEAVKQLDSERQANALLTKKLAALEAENEKLRDELTTCVCAMQDYQEFPDIELTVLNMIKGNK